MEKFHTQSIKKYDEKNPAFYNVRLQELEKLDNEVSKTGKNILHIQRYLRDSNGNLEEIVLKLGIKITRHPILPLLIFNYDHLSTPHDSLIGLECRGLVLEDLTWKIVAKPMNRFFNWGEINIIGATHPNFDNSQFDFDNFSTQSKEDGSLMVLFYYDKIDKWMLNTRTYFLNEISEKHKIIMAGINEVFSKETLDTFINSLNLGSDFDLQKLGETFLNKNNTYCFEFCSTINKIVRNYEKDTTFLLAIINNETLIEEMKEEVDRVATIIGAYRPKEYQLKSLEEIIKAMNELIVKDPSLEGFVIADKNSSRWKIKSPSYFFLHHISYDQMRTPYPKDLVPLILQGEGTELFSILEISGFLVELNEVKKQWEFCQQRLNKGFAQLKDDFNKIKQMEISSSELEIALSSIKTPLTQILRKLFYGVENSNSVEERELEHIWLESSDILVDKLFSQKEQNPVNMPQSKLKLCNVSNYKIQNFKNINTETKELVEKLNSHDNWWDYLEDSSGKDGISNSMPNFEEDHWYVECYCERQMNLFSVPEHLLSHKCVLYPRCLHCKNQKIDKNKFKGKMSNKVTHSILIYQCECGLSHASHQKQTYILNERHRRPLKGKPLGIPCSDLCLVFRHKVHEEMDLLKNLFKWDKDTIYQKASLILNVNIENAHVAMLSISQCKNLIQNFRELRGVVDK